MRNATVVGGGGPHRRFNPLTGRWVLVSAGRVNRPWQGGHEAVATPVPAYDPDCYLCPGNTRAGGARNPDYQGTFVFTNDFPALRPDQPADAGVFPDAAAPVPAAADPTAQAAAPGRAQGPGEAHRRRSGLLRAEPERGTCRVVCFDPRHDLALSAMPPARVRAVVDVWAEQERELGRAWRWVQIFENRGAAMGASNPHPHGQIWATSSLPDEPAAEDAAQRAYLDEHGVPLLVDYAELELESAIHAGPRSGAAGPDPATADRTVAVNEHWLVVVPFWAIWPFETLVLPRRPVALLQDLTDAERDALAGILSVLLRGYDALFDHPFPYSMGWHGAPGPHGDDPSSRPAHWQLHAHFYPPLLRSPTVRKHLVGYEMLAGVQRDITPEDAAARLRSRIRAQAEPMGPIAEAWPAAVGSTGIGGTFGGNIGGNIGGAVAGVRR